MDAELLKELAVLPATAILAVVIFMQQNQISKLVDAMIRMQDEITRNIAILVSNGRGLLPDSANRDEGQAPHG